MAPRWRTRTPLRITLVVALLVLVTSALVLSGVAATATLRGYLLQRVDAQLGAAAHEIAEHGLGDQPAGGPGRPRRRPGTGPPPASTSCRS